MAEFGKNLEITAMRASGVSLFRCGGPILFVGLIVTLINIYFNEALIPYTQNRAEQIYDQAADRRKSVRYLLAFRSDDGKRHWLFNAFVNGNDQKNVTLKTVWNKKMIAGLIGTPGSDKFNENLKAVFRNRSQVMLSADQAQMQSLLERELEGRKMDITAETVSYDREKHIWTFRNGKFVSYDRTDELRFEASRGTSMMHGDIKYDVLTFTEDMMPETPRDIINTVSEKDDLPTYFIAELIRRSPNMPERVKGIYMSVFFYRLAFPWACFLSVFLGIPLATKNERTGSVMAIVTAVALIVLYIVTAQVFLTLGKGGVLNPFIAGVGPTVAFIAASAWKICTDRN
jgi:lipopolysaccharide export LptBFGC system permease protein LptF